MTIAPDIELRPVPLPAGTGSDEHRWLLEGVTQVGRETTLKDAGDDDFASTVAQNAYALSHQRYVRHEWIAAVLPEGSGRPSDVVGAAWVDRTLKDNLHLAYVGVAVRPGHQRRGIGATLWDAVMARVRTSGRSTLQAATDHPPQAPKDPGRRLVPSTGSGAIELTDGARFAIARGFGLEQVERRSRLDVPIAPERLARLSSSLGDGAPPGYELVQWRGQTPPEWVEDLAELLTLISSEAPSGGLDVEQDAWDAARVAAMDARYHATGRTLWTSAAKHVASGRLVAFTVLATSSERPEIALQEETLVRPEHRGRRLGLWVKLANYELVAGSGLPVRRIGTWNAEENAHMLAINEAMGFYPAGASGEWQRVLDG